MKIVNISEKNNWSDNLLFNNFVHIIIFFHMNYSFYGSLLYASNKSEDLNLFLKKNFQEFSILLKKPSYHFVKTPQRILILLPGEIQSENKELTIKSSSSSSFKLYQDYLSIKSSHQNEEYLGVGYSNGANLILALCDIEKSIKAICFNPIGIGKKFVDTVFYNNHRLSLSEPEVIIYRIKENSLAKSFSWSSDSIKDTPWNPEYSPHNLKNFFDQDINIKIEGISKVFNSIKAISFSPKSGFLLIELENDLNNYFIEAELATIFSIVYSTPGSFSFTLVPADKYNTSGPYQSKVYYPPELEGTIIGHYLWEADWKLKQMDLGMWYDDLTGQMIPITLDISWFKSGFDFYLEESEGKSIARLWFVMEKTEFDYANDKNGVCIKPKKVSIRVQARKLNYNEDMEHGLEDAEGYHTSFKFAEFVNEHMEELCEIIPEIKKLKEICLMVSVAQFFRDDLKIPPEMINLQGLKEKILMVPEFYKKNEVPRLSRRSERKKGNEINILNLCGGVSMISRETHKIFDAKLIKYIKRTDKIVGPFYWSHYEYMSMLIEYEETADEEIPGSFSVFSVCTPNECSHPECNNFVLVDCQKLNSDLDVCIEELSPYSFEGQIFCKDHHPFLCSRKRCQELIAPGESYAELENGKFHASCIICEHCQKGITMSYVYDNGFWHYECAGKGVYVEEKQELTEEIQDHDDVQKKKVEKECIDEENKEKMIVEEKKEKMIDEKEKFKGKIGEKAKPEEEKKTSTSAANTKDHKLNQTKSQTNISENKNPRCSKTETPQTKLTKDKISTETEIKGKSTKSKVSSKPTTTNTTTPTQKKGATAKVGNTLKK